MSRNGEHNHALGLSLGASCIGVILGYSLLLFMVKPVSELVLLMGPAEMTVVILWGITLIASLSSQNILKGLIAGTFGLLIGTIGYSEAGVSRGTMGFSYLLDGMPVIPAMMGMFAASELFRLISKKYLVEDSAARRVSVREIFAGFMHAIKYPWVIILGLMFIPVLANVVKVPMPYLIPSVLALTTFGSFGLTGNLSGPVTVLVFAILGWLFKRFEYSVSAAVIGLLLGRMADESMIYSYQISGGQWSYLLERPASLLMLLLLIISLFGGKFVHTLKRRIVPIPSVPDSISR